MKLFKDLKRLRYIRKDYKTERCIKFEVDTTNYAFYILPTIFIQPWIYRYPGCSVIEIIWLNFHICIGIWRNKK